MPPRLLGPALLLAALVLPAYASAHHEPASVRYLAGAATSSSLRDGGLFCVEEGLAVNGFEGCVLAAPDEDALTITVVSDLGEAVNFAWRGFADDGAECGSHGFGLGSLTLARKEGCTHYGVAPSETALPGTIRIQ